MEPKHSANASPPDHAQDEGLLTVLDPGLYGESSSERYKLLRGALTTPDGKGPDLGALDALMQNLQGKKIRIQEALEEYAQLTDARRWPIMVMRPNTERKKLEGRLLTMGFQIVPSLASAYRKVGLIPLRVPPEPTILSTLARRPDIQRIERSWLRGSIPEMANHNTKNLVYPESLLQPEDLPKDLFGARDPLRIGIIDSGLDSRHHALQTRLMDQRAFRRDAERVGDRFGHGTASAGIIARMCPSAMFYSARVLNPQGHCHLDELIRAIAWLRLQNLDLILCNVLIPLPPDGKSILSGLLQDIVKEGTPVILPTQNAEGHMSPPACAEGTLCIGLGDGGQPQGLATLFANAQNLRVPRSIQAHHQRFPDIQPTGWTTFQSPAAAAALTAGTSALLLRLARLHNQTLSPTQLRKILLDSSGKRRTLNPQRTLKFYLNTLSNLDTSSTEPATIPLPTHQQAPTQTQQKSYTRPLHQVSDPSYVPKDLDDD